LLYVKNYFHALRKKVESYIFVGIDLRDNQGRENGLQSCTDIATLLGDLSFSFSEARSNMLDKQDAPAAAEHVPIGEQRKAKVEARRKRGRPKGSLGKKFDAASAEASEKSANLAHQIYALAAEGMTLEQIAAFFNITSQTLKDWRERDPRLERAWQQGSDDLATGRIELSMKRRAEGYDWYEISKTYDGEGNLKERKKVKRHVPADPNFAKLWVINRSSRWRHAIGDSQGVIVHKAEPAAKPRTAGMSDDTVSKLTPKKGKKKPLALYADKKKDKGREAA